MYWHLMSFNQLNQSNIFLPLSLLNLSYQYEVVFLVCQGYFVYAHYENTLIQIYRKFHLQKLKIFR